MTLQEAAIAAKRVERNTGVPAEVLVAQWAIESGWGKKAPGNNCLGIKIYPDCYGKQLLSTTEWFTDAERDYFLSMGRGRKAELKNPDQPANGKGKREYACLDLFATFPSLEACFARRAELFTLRPYRLALEIYLAEGDMERFVRGFGAIYATSPTYADLVLKIINQRNVQLAMKTPASREIPA